MNDLDDVPRWITDLVPVAERARAVLLRELPFAVAVAALAIALAMGTAQACVGRSLRDAYTA